MDIDTSKLEQAIGRLIREKRKSSELKQSFFASAPTPIKQQQFSEIEQGNRSLRFLEAIYLAIALGISLEELVPEELRKLLKQNTTRLHFDGQRTKLSAKLRLP